MMEPTEPQGPQNTVKKVEVRGCCMGIPFGCGSLVLLVVGCLVWLHGLQMNPPAASVPTQEARISGEAAGAIVLSRR